MDHAVFMIQFRKEDFPIRLIVALMVCRNKTDRKKTPLNKRFIHK